MELKSKNNEYYLVGADGQTTFKALMTHKWSREGEHIKTSFITEAMDYLLRADDFTMDRLLNLNDRYVNSYAETTTFKATEPFNNDLELTPEQHVSAKWATDLPNALIADPMGSGKTAAAICAANTLGAERILVMCPAIVKNNWKREFGRWYVHGDKDLQIINGTKKIPTAKRVIINYDLIWREPLLTALTESKFDVIIYDEVHYLQSPESKRTIAALAGGGIFESAPRHIALSGTPVKSRPIQIYAPTLAFAPQALQPFHDYYDFTKMFCEGRPSRYGWYDRGAAHLDEIAYRLRSSYMIRRRPELFRKNGARVIVQELEGSAVREYHELEKTTVLNDEKYDELLMMADIKINGKSTAIKVPMEELSAARNRMAEIKAPMIIKFMQDILETEDKVVIFAHHRFMINALAEGLKDYGVLTLTGATTNRQAVVDDFIDNPKKRILAANMIAAGTGLDGLQKVCNIAVIAETQWEPSDVEQAIARLDRKGQDKQVVAYIVTVKGSLDTQVQETFNRKQLITQEIYK